MTSCRCARSMRGNLLRVSSARRRSGRAGSAGPRTGRRWLPRAAAARARCAAGSRHPRPRAPAGGRPGRAPSAPRSGRRRRTAAPRPARRPPPRGRRGRPVCARSARSARAATSGSSPTGGSGSQVTTPVVNGVPAASSMPSRRKRRTPVATRCTTVPTGPLGQRHRVDPRLAADAVEGLHGVGADLVALADERDPEPPVVVLALGEDAGQHEVSRLEQLQRQAGAGQQRGAEREERERRHTFTVGRPGPVSAAGFRHVAATPPLGAIRVLTAVSRRLVAAARLLPRAATSLMSMPSRRDHVPATRRRGPEPRPAEHPSRRRPRRSRRPREP